MTDLPHLSPQARRVHRMARANGIDLLQKAEQGEIAADSLSDVIAGCARCTSVSGCTGWLAEHRTPVESAPGFCRNKTWFDRLKPTS